MFSCEFWKAKIHFMINHIWFVRLCGVKGEKMTDNDRKFCPLHSMSQEPYIIWLSFLVHICKMVISPGVFFCHFFKILILLIVCGVKGQWMTKNDKILCLSHPVSEEPYIIWLWFLVHKSKVVISPAKFFYLFKVLIFWCSSSILQEL